VRIDEISYIVFRGRAIRHPHPHPRLARIEPCPAASASVIGASREPRARCAPSKTVVPTTTRNRARQCAAAFTRRESRRTASDDTAPICPSPPTRSARWTTTRRPPRRRRKSRRGTPSQRRKVRATRRVSVLRWGDEKSRETNGRRRGDDIKNARNE
jgi:hypothetical protein